jgi:hypothetical protein
MATSRIFFMSLGCQLISGVMRLVTIFKVLSLSNTRMSEYEFIGVGKSVLYDRLIDGVLCPTRGIISRTRQEDDHPKKVVFPSVSLLSRRT